MANILKISEACTLAFHALALIANNPQQRFTTPRIAQTLGASENHLAKVMQRLVKAELIKSSRGPAGGFSLQADPQKTTLLQIYTAIEGPFHPEKCLLNIPVCNGRCILGSLINDINQRVHDALSQTTLAQLHDSFVSNQEKSA